MKFFFSSLIWFCCSIQRSLCAVIQNGILFVIYFHRECAMYLVINVLMWLMFDIIIGLLKVYLSPKIVTNFNFNKIQLDMWINYVFNNSKTTHSQQLFVANIDHFKTILNLSRAIVWKKESYWQNIYDTKLNCRNKYLNLLVLFSDNVYKWHQTISSDQRYRKKEYKGKKNKKKDKKTIATTTNKINKVKTFAMSNKVEK